VLLPPLTGLEALEHAVQGGVLVIKSRLSLNMAAHTLEQVLSRRRKMLMDMCSGIELEIRDQLDFKLGMLAIRTLKHALQFGPFSQDTEWFKCVAETPSLDLGGGPLTVCSLRSCWLAPAAHPSANGSRLASAATTRTLRR
jgi:hypothetical protein